MGADFAQIIEVVDTHFSGDSSDCKHHLSNARHMDGPLWAASYILSWSVHWVAKRPQGAAGLDIWIPIRLLSRQSGFLARVGQSVSRAEDRKLLNCHDREWY